MCGFWYWKWYFDEMYVKVNGEMVYFWCVVDYEGEVLESFVIRMCDKKVVFIFMRKVFKWYGLFEVIIIDGLCFYKVVMNVLGNVDK